MSSAASLSSWGWVDWTLLAIIGFSVLIGLWRGLVFEVMSVAGWLVAYFGAQWFTPQWSAYVPFAVPVGEPGSALNHAATFVISFVALLVTWGIGSKLLRMMVRAVPGISGVDRLMGGVFGLVRAMVLMLAIATVVGLTPLSKSTAWQQSHVALWTKDLLLGLKAVLPSDFYDRLAKAGLPV